MTTLGDARTVGAENVAGSVGDSFGRADIGRSWSQSAQFDTESTIEMKHDKKFKVGQVIWRLVFEPHPLSQPRSRQ